MKQIIKTKLSLVTALVLGASSAVAEEKNVKKLDDVTITGVNTSTYHTNEKPSISRSSVDLGDMSRSAQIFNSDLIKDYQPTAIKDIVTLSSNVAFSGDIDGRELTFKIRGFDAPILKDGVSADFGDVGFETFAYERVEVLKGPDSIQFGTSQPGGLINAVRKKPKDESHGEIVLDLSTNPGYGLKTDIGANIEGTSARFRVVGVYNNEESYKDFNDENEKKYIAPSLAYDFNDNHTITLWGEFLDETNVNDMGSVVNESNGELLVPIEFVITHPDDMFEREQKNFGFDLNSKFGSWNTNLKFANKNYDYDYGPVYLPFMYDPSTSEVVRVFATQAQTGDDDVLQFTANNEFRIADIRNRITFGYDYKRQKTVNSGVWDPSAQYRLNIFNPVYGLEPLVSDHPSATDYSTTNKTIQSGIFLQDYIDLTDNLIVSLGLRHSKYKPQGGKKTKVTTPQFGLTYKVNKNFSTYFNYSESFVPNTAINSSGKLLEPETGEGYEVGAKYKINNNLNFNAAIFKIEKTNVAMPDPSAPTLFSIAGGKQTSEGFEFDLIGNINDEWSIIGSYGYTKTEDKVDNPGKELTSVPKHTANLHTIYNLRSFGMPNYTIGLGAKYIGERFGNADNSFKLPSVITYNASLAYEDGPWGVNLSVKNLTDEHYVESATATARAVETGIPRYVSLAVTYKF